MKQSCQTANKLFLLLIAKADPSVHTFLIWGKSSLVMSLRCQSENGFSNEPQTWFQLLNSLL